MATRASEAEVLAIMLDNDMSEAQVTPFLTAANITVTDILGSNTDLSTTQKKEIERWFTAHLVASVAHRQAQEEKADDAMIKYTGKTGLKLDSTYYGQVCQQLDTTGIFAQRLGKKKIRVHVIPQYASTDSRDIISEDT